MNKRRSDDTLGAMENKQQKIVNRYRLFNHRVLTVAGLILLPLLIGGCNALGRGDFLRQTDDTTMFSSIGFLMSDNPELYRNAVTEVSRSPNDIFITIPYYETDGITPLLPDTMKLTFNVVGKDTIVLLDGVTSINPGDVVDFHDGAGNPYPRLFTIYKQVIGSETPQTSDIWVHVSKAIKPKLMNPHQPGVPAPLILELAFVDENGTKVDMTSNNYDIGRTYWDNWRLEMPAAPGYQAGSDSFEVPNVRPYYPGDHPITIDEDCFFDNNGYYSQYGEVNLFYAPPAIHISTRVGSPGSGTGFKDDPFYSWDQAITELTLVPGTYFDIFIEASDTPYDLDTGAVIFNGINGPANFLNIYGGYKPGFDGRYDGDWDNRPQTILIATNQIPGTTDILPGPAFTMNSVGNDFVLDNLVIISSDVLFGTALLIDNASPKISDITLGAASNSMEPGSAMTVLNGSNLMLSNGRFFGKSGGAGKSTGIYVDNSFLELYSPLITGGDLADICYGIEVQNGSLNIFGGAIISGIIDAETDNFIETENKGIFALNSNINLHKLWIHATDGTGISTALEVNNTPAFIENSTFISGRTPIPRGIYILNGGGNFELYNSVVRVADSNGAGDAAGIMIENAGLSIINGNAIRVGSGGGPNQTIGIDLINSPAVEFYNNLIWSGSSGDMLGIRSDLAIAGAPIRHNNFWHTGGDAKLELVPGTQWKIYDWQNPLNAITGNFSLPVAVDMAFDYATDDMDVGRILGSVPNDISYGGEDLFGMFPDYDREGRLRTAEDGIGWSIGPYEYGNDFYLPTTVHVADKINGGDDAHPIGSRKNPFETIQKAWSYILSKAYVPYTIRVSQGTYDIGNFTFNKDARILGGYSIGFGSRNISAYPTIIDNNSSMIFNISGVSRDFLLEGFTLKTTNAGNTRILVMDLSAKPVIRNNKIIGGSGTSSKAIDITDEANPLITANHIFGGFNTDFSHGIFIQEAGARIYNNVIHAGTATLPAGYSSGIEFLDNDISPNFNPVQIYNNTIFGGVGGSSSAGIRSLDDNLFVVNNILIAGSTMGGVTFGHEIGGSSPPFEISNNLFLFGPPDPNRHAISILGSIWNTVADMENDLTVTYARSASGNRMDGTNDPSIYFMNFVPDMTEAGFLAENWNLSAAGPENARTGGLDLSGNFSRDRDGSNRSVPWSIGAYEY